MLCDKIRAVLVRHWSVHNHEILCCSNNQSIISVLVILQLFSLLTQSAIIQYVCGQWKARQYFICALCHPSHSVQIFYHRVLLQCSFYFFYCISIVSADYFQQLVHSPYACSNLFRVDFLSFSQVLKLVNLCELERALNLVE